MFFGVTSNASHVSVIKMDDHEVEDVVDNQAQLQKIDELNQLVEELRRENEFTIEIMELPWKEKVEESRKLIVADKARLEQLRKEKDEGEAYINSKHAAEIEAMKAEHSSKVTELENAYEDRLLGLTNKIIAQENEHKAIERGLENEMSEKVEQHQAQFAELESSSHRSESNLREKIDCLIAGVESTEKMRQEMLARQDEEHAKELSLQCFQYQKRLDDKQNDIDEVNVTVQKLVAKREWLSRQAKELKVR